MKRLPLRNRVFWSNFLQSLIVFIGLSIILGGIGMEDGGHYSFLTGYLIASFFAIIILSGKVAMGFAKNVEIDEFMTKNNIDRKEFREKYGKLFDI